MLALCIWGARISLFVGLFATAISMVHRHADRPDVGVLRGLAGAVLYRLTEWFLVIPFLLLALVLAAVLGRLAAQHRAGHRRDQLAGTALLIRSQTLSIKERPYLERARALGAGRWHQMTRHILPNVMPMVFANTTLTVSVAILTETTLSFLGLGDPTRVSWGSMLEDAFGVGRHDDRRLVVHHPAGPVRGGRGALVQPGRPGARGDLQPAAAEALR